MTTDEFIDKSKQVHGNKYDYSKVQYVNNKTKVYIGCPMHGGFLQLPYCHLNGQGCPKCGKEKASEKQRCTTEEFIEKARKIHGDKYDYRKVEYTGNKNKVCIICHERDEHGCEHGEFYQQALTHIRGYGCPKCSHNHRKNTEEFINEARKVHGDKYDYSKVEYKTSHDKVCIICHEKDIRGIEHGEFWQMAREHLKGSKCPKCQHKNILAENVLSKFKKIHGGKYDYSKFKYINIRTKSCIICPIHGEFWQTPKDHGDGYGCPKCSHTYSREELSLSDYVKCILPYNKIITNTNNVIPPYELDIYIPEKRIAIEYDGLIWHSEKFGKDKYYHLNKTELCEKQRIRLIHIFEDEWLEHEDIVKSKLKHILGCDNDLCHVSARECVIRNISIEKAKSFLDENNINGFLKSDVYLGCFYNELLIGIMSFRYKNNEWELTRFATDINYICRGVISKLFSSFIRKYNPSNIVSFADRRWVFELNKNIYDKLGFKKIDYSMPNYYYLNGHNRISEFPNKLRFPKLYRIWDCGTIKYQWINKN